MRLIARGRADDAPILHTLFSPLTVARKLAGDRLVEDLRQDPAAVEPALDAITETMARHARAALEAGADGLFFATQAAAPDVVTAEESARFDLPRMRRMLDAVAGRSAFTLLHVHGRDIYFDQTAGLPVHAVNWHDRLTAPALGDAQRRFTGALVGGLGESRTLLNGPPEAVAAEVRDALAQTGGLGNHHRARLRAAAGHARRSPGRGGGGGEGGGMRRRAPLRLAAVLVLLLVAGPAAAQSPGELRVALPWTPENLDPTMNLSSIRAKVGVSIFDSLVGRDAENRIAPQLAESWKALDDLTLQLKLRRGVVFHNGEPFNAEAVRFTFERVLDPNQKSPNRANVGEVARVEVVDDYTVNLVLRQPYAPLLNRLIDFPIVPPKYTAEKGNQGLALRPVGTGPFKFVELVKDDHMIVEAFDRHWRGAPKIRRIVYKPIPEPFTRAAALRNNEVDVIDTVPPNLAGELERARRHPGAARAEHVDHLSGAQRLQEAALGRAGAPGPQLRDRHGRAREERARRQRPPHGRARSRRRCSASTRR